MKGKIKTIDEQKAFMKHLETLVNDMIMQMKDQGTRFSDFQAKTELLLFLKRVNESSQFADKFRTQALLHSSSLDLGKRSRFQSSDRTDTDKSKARGSSSSASKEKLLKTFQKGRSQDEDDDFDDDT